MNEPSLNDPQLQSLEARLAAMTPQESSARQQALLYQCAFAAGRSSAQKTTRRWQAAATTFALLAIAMSVPLARTQLLIAGPRAQPIVLEQPVQPQPPALVQQESIPEVRQAAHVDVDAWQTPLSASASLDKDLARFEQTDGDLRWLTVGALTRSVLGL
jgi:hypothetical protein